MATLLQDTFGDTNGTPLTGHTMDVGPGWTVNATASAKDIQSNRASIAKGGGNPRDFCWSDSGAADCVITVIGRTDDTGATIDCVFRAVDVSNLWYCGIQHAGGGLFYIIKRESGSGAFSASTPVTVSLNTDYTIQVTLSGSSIIATMDGANEISDLSATFQQSETRHGIGSANDTSTGTVLFDNFSVASVVSYVPFPRTRGLRGGMSALSGGKA